MCGQQIKTSAVASLFDLSLTPRNAGKKGYTYIDDVIFDQINPSEAIRDLIELSHVVPCKFGKPNNVVGNDPYYGLYIPNEEGETI